MEIAWKYDNCFFLQEPRCVSVLHSVWHRGPVPALQTGYHLAGAATHHIWYMMIKTQINLL